MSCEVPVVVSNVGGLPEVVTDGKEGYLVGAHDVETMAKRSIEILADEERRREMGRRGRETAKARFCSDAIVTQYENYYRRILSAV